MMDAPDRERYLRQIAIDGFGDAGQEKLARARAWRA